MSSGGTEVIGGKNFWLYSQDKGYDLTHPPSPTSPLIFPRIPLKTKSGPVAIDPSKTALVIIDLQNYFVAPELGRPSDSLGMQVINKLLKHAIPSCRKAGIPIVWLGWGVTEDDIDEMPPTIIKGFAADTNFVGHKKLGPLGSDIGLVELEDGTTIDGGQVLMKDQWNSRFWRSLSAKSQQNDINIYKNLLSGFWGGTGIEDALTSRGIKTLLFAGCNTDQCVGGSIQDAYTKGWDCLLLSDGTATTSPSFAQQSIEYNCDGGWGFVLTCEQLADGVRNMQKAAAENLRG
ncbi:Isochorismatase-like protein [Hypoxylon argillaceum]|nr:Isochorismatase-like protein [Hypoxylon argillaceum]